MNNVYKAVYQKVWDPFKYFVPSYLTICSYF